MLRRGGRWGAGALALVGLLGLANGGPIGAQEKATVTLTGEAKRVESATQFQVIGTTSLPNNALILGRLTFRGAPVADTRGIVRENAFSLRFGPWKKVVLAGKYEVQIGVPKELQHPDLRAQLASVALERDTLAIEVGSKAEADRAIESVKRKLTDVAELYRLSFLGLAQAGTYYRDELRQLMLAEKHGDSPPEVREKNKRIRAERIPRILSGWNDMVRSYWQERFKTARFDWRLYREQLLANPFPEADAHLDQLARAMDAWYRGMTRALYNLMGKELPAEVKEGPVFEPQHLYQSVVDAGDATYKALGYPGAPNGFALTELSQLEHGNLDGDVYRSFVTKFRIKKPKGWLMRLGAGGKPSARLRIVPAEAGDAAARSEILIAVEILDYQTAQDHRHLAALAKEQNHGRWRGGSVSSKDIQPTDPTMPGGKRPGLDSEFTAVEGALNMHGRYYQLFCRWHKRTYGVLCLAPQARWEDVKADFAATCSSFRVLDAPEFENLREEEIREKLKAEGRDPDKALGGRRAWERGEDEAEGTGGKTEQPKGEKKP